MENKIQKVMDILLKEFYSVYCDTCEYHGTVLRNECNECHRKYMNWALSVNTAKKLAEEIIEVIANE